MMTELLAGIITLVTVVFGYFKVRDQLRFTSIEDKLRVSQEYSNELKTEVDTLKVKVDECESDRIELRKQINEIEKDKEKLQDEILEVIDSISRIERGKLEAIIQTDHTGKIKEWNSEATALFGWTESEVIGHDVLMLVPPDLRHIHVNAIRKINREDRQPRIEPLYSYAVDRNNHRMPVCVRLSGWKENDTWIYSAEIKLVSEEDIKKNLINKSI